MVNKVKRKAAFWQPSLFLKRHFLMKEISKKAKLKFIRRVAWGFSLPALAFQLIFGWLPVAVIFILALQEFHMFKPSIFVGLSNFKFLLFNNQMTLTVFRNTLYYVGLSLALIFLVPIFVAILLMEMKKNIIRIMMILWFIPIA